MHPASSSFTRYEILLCLKISFILPLLLFQSLNFKHRVRQKPFRRCPLLSFFAEDEDGDEGEEWAYNEIKIKTALLIFLNSSEQAWAHIQWTHHKMHNNKFSFFLEGRDETNEQRNMSFLHFPGSREERGRKINAFKQEVVNKECIHYITSILHIKYKLFTVNIFILFCLGKVSPRELSECIKDLKILIPAWSSCSHLLLCRML